MTLPPQLTHSWPLSEQRQRLDLGMLLDEPEEAPVDLERQPAILAAHAIGLWECCLQDDALVWTDGVYELFGLPQGAAVERRDIVALYAESSRAAMERLRAHAIRHRRGFTLDAEIHPVTGPRKWMRLIAAPVCVGRQVVGLQGIKQDVSAIYR